MDFLILILVVVLLFVILSVKNNIGNKLHTLEFKLVELSKLLKEIKSEREKSEITPSIKSAESAIPTPKIVPTPPTHEPSKKIEDEVIRTVPVEDKPNEESILQQYARREEIKKVQEQSAANVLSGAPSVPPQKKAPAPPKPGFFERNPDLEKFIGENLANKIGIAILVIGIGFFVKYAIDQDWINEIGRVFIGILCGGILLGVAHKLQKKFVAFSSVLVGGGIAVLYFTITIAFQEYQIFSQTAAFILMVVITGFAVLLSLGYNRVELAVLAILGGFGSPFMVSTGEGNYIVLFTYILILNIGMLVLAYYKKWRIVNIVCYVFTIMLFGGWLSSIFQDDEVSMIRNSLLFATMFYFIFFAMNIVSNLKLRMKFETAEILMLLSNTFLYYSAGMFVLNNPIGEDFRGLFTALLGVFNFVFAYSLYKNANADRNLVFMLIGLVLTFISLAAPIQLKGNHITLFWAAETVLLLWLYQKSEIKLMGIASVVVMGLMVVSLLLDWKNIYFEYYASEHMSIFLNKGYITGVVAIVSLVLTERLLRSESPASLLRPSEYRQLITVATIGLLYFVNLHELRYQLDYYVDSAAAQTVIIGAYNMAFILVAMLTRNRISAKADIQNATGILGFIAMGAYLFYYHGFIVDSRDEYLRDLSSFTGFLFHYLLVALLVIALIISLKLLNKNRGVAEIFQNAHWWVYVFVFVFIASAELDHTVLLTAYSTVESGSWLIEENHRIGYPILWGISSFGLIAFGFSRKIRMVRVISLVLFLVTLLKLFIIDLRDISEGGKIAAFISLGILLLVVSFMYQRLKKLLLDDTQGKEEQAS